MLRLRQGGPKILQLRQGGHQKFYASANQENVKFIFAATISVAALHLVHAVRPVNIRAEHAKTVFGSCTLRKYVCVLGIVYKCPLHEINW